MNFWNLPECLDPADALIIGYVVDRYISGKDISDLDKAHFYESKSDYLFARGRKAHSQDDLIMAKRYERKANSAYRQMEIWEEIDDVKRSLAKKFDS